MLIATAPSNGPRSDDELEAGPGVEEAEQRDGTRPVTQAEPVDGVGPLSAIVELVADEAEQRDGTRPITQAELRKAFVGSHRACVEQELGTLALRQVQPSCQLWGVKRLTAHRSDRAWRPFDAPTVRPAEVVGTWLPGRETLALGCLAVSWVLSFLTCCRQGASQLAEDTCGRFADTWQH